MPGFARAAYGIATIRASASTEISREKLVSKFSLTVVQANAILDMRLQKLTGLERDKIVAEYKELLKEIAADPEHRDYPNITEKDKLQIMAQVREKIRVQKLAALELKRVARDTDEVKALIAENLAHRPKPPVKP